GFGPEVAGRTDQLRVGVADLEPGEESGGSRGAGPAWRACNRRPPWPCLADPGRAGARLPGAGRAEIGWSSASAAIVLASCDSAPSITARARARTVRSDPTNTRSTKTWTSTIASLVWSSHWHD